MASHEAIRNEPVEGKGGVRIAWVVLAADPAQVETFTFPLLLLNATTGDLNQMQVSGSLAPVSDGASTGIASIPQFRDFSAAPKLANLRLSTVVQVPVGGAKAGSNVTFNSQVVNDTGDLAHWRPASWSAMFCPRV